MDMTLINEFATRLKSNGSAAINMLPVTLLDVTTDEYKAAWDTAWDSAVGSERLTSNSGPTDCDMVWNGLTELMTVAMNDMNFSTLARWTAARGAMLALMVRDIVTDDVYTELTILWRTNVSKVHPDDERLI